MADKYSKPPHKREWYHHKRCGTEKTFVNSTPAPPIQRWRVPEPIPGPECPGITRLQRQHDHFRSVWSEASRDTVKGVTASGQQGKRTRKTQQPRIPFANSLIASFAN